jgi:hypothetical protein
MPKTLLLKERAAKRTAFIHRKKRGNADDG